MAPNDTMATPVAATDDDKRGYLLAYIKINDAEKFQTYMGLAKPSVIPFGGRALASRQLQVVEEEGKSLYQENDAPGYDVAVVLEFPTVQAATDWYHSEAYKEALGIRLASTNGPLVIGQGNVVDDNYKGLVLAFVTATTKDGMSEYDPIPSVKAYGGKRLVKASPDQLAIVEEGKPFDYVVLLSFETPEKATAWMQSEEYAAQKAIRLAHSTGPLAILQGLH